MKPILLTKMAIALSLPFLLLLAITPWRGQGAPPQITVSLVADVAPGPAARHGLNKLIAALKAKGVGVEQASRLDEAREKVLIVAGSATGAGAAAELRKTLGVAAPEGAESLLIRRARWGGKPALLISGADDRGLMYAMLDVADRVGWAADANLPLGEVRDAALAKFLKLAPGLHAVQFRMHGESGLKKEEMPAFWQGIYQVMKEHGPNVIFDARVKDFPDSLIDLALDMGVKIRLNTKYWAEQMGLPFHPTRINKQNQHDRGHGYADLLRYPQRYNFQWQLWAGSATRILLWGDPEYARRFAESTHIYAGSGFEVNEPLATKMASHPHEMEPFELLRPQYRYYDWEFERNWHFFQVFGRMGYNPDTPPEVWKKEFEVRLRRENVQNRAEFLKLIDRPRAPLTPDAQELDATDGLAQTHFTFAADAEQRVPGILVKQAKSAGRRPVVVALHGTGGNKEGQLVLLKELAGLGFIGVAIDGRYHGERSKAGKGSAEYNEAILRAYRTGREHPFLYDTVWDVLRLIDYLETRADVDAQRIGLIGFSKGGMETYLAAAVDPRVAVAIPCIGVQSFRWALENNAWKSRVETFQAALNGAVKDAGLAEINADFVRKFYDRVVPGVDKEFDGPEMLPLIAPRPLLVINGDSDPRTPMPGVMECAKRARQAYANARAEDKFQLLIQEKTGHAVTPAARQAAIAWFVKWLKP